MSDMKARMHTGDLYLPNDESIMEEQTKCLDRLYDFNQTRPTEGEKRQALMKEMFAEVGEGCYIEPPFHANWGGRFVHLGINIYFTFHFPRKKLLPIEKASRLYKAFSQPALYP